MDENTAPSPPHPEASNPQDPEPSVPKTSASTSTSTIDHPVPEEIEFSFVLHDFLLNGTQPLFVYFLENLLFLYMAAHFKCITITDFRYYLVYAPLSVTCTFKPVKFMKLNSMGQNEVVDLNNTNLYSEKLIHLPTVSSLAVDCSTEKKGDGDDIIRPYYKDTDAIIHGKHGNGVLGKGIVTTALFRKKAAHMNIPKKESE